jgi:hypothetical protein
LKKEKKKRKKKKKEKGGVVEEGIKEILIRVENAAFSYP